MTRFSFLAIGLIVALAVPAIAQIPMPKAPDPAAPAVEQPARKAEAPVAPVATIPDFDAERKGTPADTYTDTMGRVLSIVTNQPVNMTEEEYKNAQDSYEDLRKSELAAGGYRWIPWMKAGPTVWDFVYARDPEMRANIDRNLGWFLDVAVADVDRNNKPDIMVWDHSSCTGHADPDTGQEQCSFTIYFDNKGKTTANYVAFTMKPFEHGVILDDEGYYSQ